MEARGLAVANSLRAKASGEEEDLLKSMEEKEIEPDVTSGTLERVLAVAEQVMVFWREAATSATSAGSAVVPTTKQALAWRVAMMGVAAPRERREKRVTAWECILALILGFKKKSFVNYRPGRREEWNNESPSQRMQRNEVNANGIETSLKTRPGRNLYLDMLVQ